MLFTVDAHPRLADGSITLTFRTWSRPQAKVGGSYRIGGSGLQLVVDDLRQVRVGDITDDEARQAGEADAAALRARLAHRPAGRYRGAADFAVDDDTEVWRVAFHAVADTEPRLRDQSDLGDDEVAEITRRLDRLDAAAAHGPWTRATLQLIAANEGVVSTTLAESLGRERFAFKEDVRKLKRLGLTESLLTGYRISPRGAAYLSRN